MTVSDSSTAARNVFAMYVALQEQAMALSTCSLCLSVWSRCLVQVIISKMKLFTAMVTIVACIRVQGGSILHPVKKE